MTTNNQIESRMNIGVEFDEQSVVYSDERKQLDIRLPLDGDVVCPICNPEGAARARYEIKELYKHIERKHGEVNVSNICRRCNKSFNKPVGVSIHQRTYRPMATAPAPANEYEVACGECNRRFKNQRALSAHKNSALPQVRNKKRQETGQKAPRASTSQLWTDDEIKTLRELCEVYECDVQINRRIRDHLVGKTCKQISDKRRSLRLIAGVQVSADVVTAAK